MALRVNRFKPDTCDCVIDFSFDADLPLDKVESSYQLVSIQKGPCHVLLSDDDAYQSAWHKENKTKNQVEGALMAALATHTQLDAEGNTQWKPSVKFKFQFDAKRDLSVDVIDAKSNASVVTPLLKTSAQSAVSALAPPINVKLV